MARTTDLLNNWHWRIDIRPRFRIHIHNSYVLHPAALPCPALLALLPATAGFGLLSHADTSIELVIRGLLRW